MNIPDHPEIACALATGYPHPPKELPPVYCDECSHEMTGDEKVYDYDGEAMCENCCRDRIMEDIDKKPIPSWDNFMAWLGLNYEAIGDATLNMSSCQLQTIDGGTSISMGIVDFAKVKNFVTFMEQVEIKAPAALRKPLTMFQLDDYVFGFALHMTSSPDEDGNTATLHVGFMFRQ